MISIRKSVSELDRHVRLREVTAFSYGASIGAVGEYAVALNPSDTDALRQHLDALRQAVEAATDPEDFEAIQASFRGELREYRDKSRDWLARMHAEMRAAAEAMQALAEGMALNGGDHELRLKSDLQTLQTAAQSQDLAQIQAIITAAVLSIAESYDQMRRANQLTFAQLQDEIRALHREMDSERKALFTDRVSGAWNRQKMDNRIAELLSRGDRFCVVIAWLNNFKRIEGRSAPVVEGTLKALTKRAGTVLGREAMFGRWHNDQFAAILETDPTAAIAASGDLARELSAKYAVQENGTAQHLTLGITTVVVDRPPGGDPDKFRQRLEQASTVLRGI